jgi:hypothetical protein
MLSRTGTVIVMTDAEAADLYRSGMSACEVAATQKPRPLTKSGAEEKIRRGGARGLQWCSVHRKYEVL